MAFTLEAAIAVPTCLIVFTTIIGMSVPAYKQAETACNLSAQAANSSAENRLIYCTQTVGYLKSYTSCVSTCPDGLIDIYRLGHDLLLPLGDLLEGDDKID